MTGSQSGKILIADDDAHTRNLLRELLESWGYQVAVAEDGATRPLLEANRDALPGMERPDAFVGTNVFVLFDTSNFMYKGFVYAEDAIADFVRGLDRADSVAVYTFSRNMSRAAPLTRTWPDAGRSKPAARRSKERVPEPSSPTMPMTAPSGAVALRFSIGPA